ncbi:M64 family metallopeptidase [Virgibacillus soli]|uniref:M64 family metallopeptidase n=1 Tax=Paracerasibacillus soli TaxID=480284 RepID=UPI0035ECCA91
MGNRIFRKLCIFVLMIPLLVLSFGKIDVSHAQSVSADNQKLELGDVNIVPLQVTGPAEDRLNLIIFGDGYTADEMDKFREDVDRNQNVQWSVEPFRSYRNYFNVYMVETPSVDSGISCDPDDGNVRRDTVFHLQYANRCPADELARGVTFGTGGAEARNKIMREYIAPALGISENDQNIQTLTIGNTFTYGGIGGVHATTTGGSPQGPLVSLHELGHSLGNLQDEYSYYDRGVPGGPHPDQEPNSIHHTRMTSEEMIEKQAKWWRWLGEESESGGLIKAADPDGYESGQYSSSNIWRPSKHSMMRHTGFYFDQVSREQMTQRITGMRNAEEMPLTSTPEGEIGKDEILSVETMYPRFHLLDVTWAINGEIVANTNNARHLDLSKYDVKQDDIVKVTIQDKTQFVRDPNYLDGPRMTQTREWTIGSPQNVTEVDVVFTNHSTTAHALALDEIVFVETPNPTDRLLNVTWKLNGEVLADAQNSRFLDLNEIDLPQGELTLSATVTDPQQTRSDSETISWIVDNQLPTAPRKLTEPIATLPGEVEHHVYFNKFDMKLEPQDDQTGFVVGEIRLNKSGWYNYFGFPEEPEGEPFTFSYSGTDIKELTYGNLGTGGLSIVTYEKSYTEEDPGEKFVPGFDTHFIEHRAIDAAGNIGNAEEYYATVIPGEQATCTHAITEDYQGDLHVTEGVTCLENITVTGDVFVQKGASLVISNSTINGDIEAEEAHTIQMFGAEVNGQTYISQTIHDTTLVGNTFNGWLILRDNEQVSANAQYDEYGPVLVGNTIHGVQGCYENRSDIADFGAPNRVSAFNVGDCANADLSATTLINYVAQFGELDVFATEDTKRSFSTHLTSLAHFEQRGLDDKALKHLSGFEILLEQKYEQGLIAKQAYIVLTLEAKRLHEHWEQN